VTARGLILAPLSSGRPFAESARTLLASAGPMQPECADLSVRDEDDHMDAPDPYEARLPEPDKLTALCRHCSTLIRWHRITQWRHAIVGLDRVGPGPFVPAQHVPEPIPMPVELTREDAHELVDHAQLNEPRAELIAKGTATFDAPAGAGDDVEAYRG
jgi:hypothetical protein